jgi:MFS family permease
LHEANLRSWIIWLTAGAFYLFEFVHRVALSVMLPELSQSFNVSSALLSGLAASYFFAYAFAQIPVGLLIDRYGTRRLLTLACLTITIGSFLFAYTDNIFLATYCRILIGFGSAFAFVGCLKLAASWFPAHRFAFIVGLTNLFGVAGALIGGNPIAHAVDAFGWRDVMYSSGIVGLVITFLLWKIVRDGSKNKKTELIRFKLLAVIENRQTWLIAIFAGCMVAPIVSYSELWGVTYLMQTYSLSRPDAAHITTLTFIGIAIGGPLIGWLSDYFRQRTVFMAIGLAGALVTMSLILFGPLMPLWLISLLHIIFGFFTSSMLLCFSLNSEATSANIRATTIAFTNSIIMLFGALSQTLSGYLLDITYNNFNLSFMPIIACYIIALVCFKFIRSTKCTFCD